MDKALGFLRSYALILSQWGIDTERKIVIIVEAFKI